MYVYLRVCGRAVQVRAACSHTLKGERGSDPDFGLLGRLEVSREESAMKKDVINFVSVFP